MMEIWEDFLAFENAYEILMAIGALMLLIGIWNILKVGFKAILCVLLVGLGSYTLSYGLDRSSMGGISLHFSKELRALVGGRGRELSMDAMKRACEKFDALADSSDGTEKLFLSWVKSNGN